MNNTFGMLLYSKQNIFQISYSFPVVIFKLVVQLQWWVCTKGDEASYLLRVLTAIFLQDFLTHPALRQMTKKLLRLRYLAMVSWVNPLLRNYTQLLC